MEDTFKRLAHHDTTAPANQPIYNGYQDQLNVDSAEPVASVQRDDADDVIPTEAPEAALSNPSEQSEVQP